MSEQEQQPAGGGIDGLIKALTEHTEAMRDLTHSNALLSAAVAELLGEETGKPVQDDEQKEPAPDSLDAD